MEIKRFSVRGYKSIASAEFSPGAMTLLVGPNNSGKTNLVDSIEFLSDVYKEGVNAAIEHRGGFENIAFRKGGKPVRSMSFDIELSLKFDQLRGHPIFGLDDRSTDLLNDNIVGFVFRHSFTIKAERSDLISEHRIVGEDFYVGYLLGDDSDRLGVSIRGGVRSRVAIGEFEEKYRLIFRSAPNNTEKEMRFIINAFKRNDALRVQSFPVILSDVCTRFLEPMRRFRVYRLSPDACRRPSPPSSAGLMDPDGYKLPNLVHYLRTEVKTSWNRAMTAMREINPDLVDVLVRTNSDRLRSLEFIERGGRSWNASEVSDGTVRALAMFAACVDPRAGGLVIEEPENALHPWILRVFVSLCREVSAFKGAPSIVLTSHSPVLISEMRPEEIQVVWRVGGATNIAELTNLDPDIARIWRSGNADLFAIIDSGLIRMAVPGQ